MHASDLPELRNNQIWHKVYCMICVIWHPVVLLGLAAFGVSVHIA